MGLTIDAYEALPGNPEWVNPENPTLSKCDVIAWFRLSRLVEVVAQEAELKKRKR